MLNIEISTIKVPIDVNPEALIAELEAGMTNHAVVSDVKSSYMKNDKTKEMNFILNVPVTTNTEQAELVIKQVMMKHQVDNYNLSYYEQPVAIVISENQVVDVEEKQGYKIGETVRQYHHATLYDDAVITCVHENGALDVVLKDGTKCGWSVNTCKPIAS